MAFYLKPPSGNISLEKLEAFACRRLCFLIKVLETSFDINNNFILTDLISEDVSMVADSDCLIEGTKKDQISHFILRMALSEFDNMWEWFENAEKTLFNLRFLCMEPDEILESLEPVWRIIRKLTWNSDTNILSLKGALRVLHEIPATCGDWSHVIDGYFSDSHSGHFTVPFLYSLDLVRKREVMLEKGKVLVPFRKLNVIMASIFKSMLHFSRPKLKEVRKKLNDERLFKLFEQLQSHLKLKLSKANLCSGTGLGFLNHQNVDYETQFFPPCMVYNHNQLRSKHRLKHHSRIRYTLFLKEAGLPIDEALIFWRNEYSQKCKDHETKCLHSWDKDSKRYIYNIRHLYGLEGCRTNYRTHTCASLQSSCGGCPFFDFDEVHLKDLLLDEKMDSLNENIMALVKQKKPSEACSMFFWEKLKRLTKNHEKSFQKNIQSNNTKSQQEFCSCSVDSIPKKDISNTNRNSIDSDCGHQREINENFDFMAGHSLQNIFYTRPIEFYKYSKMILDQ